MNSEYDVDLKMNDPYDQNQDVNNFDLEERSESKKYYRVKYLDFETRLWIKHCFFELFGTAIFLFLGCTGSATVTNYSNIADAFIVASSFGLGLFMASSIFSTCSQGNGHFNPLISISYFFYSTKRFVERDTKSNQIYNLRYLFGSVISQFTGAILGASMSLGVINLDYLKKSVTVPSPIATESYNIIFAECFGTLIITLFVILNKPHRGTGALNYGLCLLGLTLSMYSISGGGFNIARSLSTAILTKNYNDFWKYSVGQFCGCAIASILFFIIDPDELEDCNKKSRRKQ